MTDLVYASVIDIKEPLKISAEAQEKTEGVVSVATDARRLAEKREGRGEGIVTYVDLSRLALKKTHISVGLFDLG